MLLVVSVIALLIAMVLPALGQAKEAALRTTCMVSMHQLGNALPAYTTDNAGKLPFDNWRGVETAAPTTTPAGWIYDFKVKDPMAFTAGDPLDRVLDHMKTGTFWPYVRNHALYRCPKDPRPPWDGKLPVRQMISYPMNGAVSGYGRRGGMTFNMATFRSDAILLWEVDYSFWWDGSDHPSQGMIARHLGGGCAASADGTAEWMHVNRYDELERQRPGRLWCVPDTAGGQ